MITRLNITYLYIYIYILYSDFKTFFDAVHGNCYVFNTGWSGANVLHQASNTGRKHGIQISFFMKKHVEGIYFKFVFIKKPTINK